MAKMKRFAVEIEHTVRETIYVSARRPNGAAERALTDEAYREAHAYDGHGEDCDWYPSLPKDARVVKVREV